MVAGAAADTVPAAAGVVPVAVVAPPSANERLTANAPAVTSRLSAIATAVEMRSPKSGTSHQPPANAPAAAPKVFAA